MSENEQEGAGAGTGRQGPWERDEEGARGAHPEGDAGALEVENDPRGGLQSEAYRTADPRELVQEGDTVMSAPGGAPQEGLSVDERRAHGEKFRRERDEDDPLPGKD